MTPDEPVEAAFFATPGEFREWLERIHQIRDEIWVGFHKKGTGRPSITWPEAVDEALCVGWIDGLRRSIDAERYRIRFTPRRPRSAWSVVNVGRVEALSREGRMREAGLAAFALRVEGRSGIYSHEQRRKVGLDPAMEARFRADPQAWEYFQCRPPSYRRAAAWWVISAKREATRSARLERLIAASGSQRLLPQFARKGG